MDWSPVALALVAIVALLCIVILIYVGTWTYAEWLERQQR